MAQSLPRGGHPLHAQRGRSRQAQTEEVASPDPDDLFSWFVAVDQDDNNQISAVELKQALLNDNWTRFDMETVNMLIGMFDVDEDGEINFNEFKLLWDFLDTRKKVFRQFDKDRNGTIEAGELKNALHSVELALPEGLIHLLVYKFDGVAAGDSAPGLSFDGFIHACVFVKHFYRAYNELPRNDHGYVQMDFNKLMELVLSAP